MITLAIILAEVSVLIWYGATMQKYFDARNSQ